MKKPLPILFLLCSVAVFAEEKGQELPVGKGECLSPGIIFVPIFLLAIIMIAIPMIYYIAKSKGKINRKNKVWWIIISILAGIVISPIVLFFILLLLSIPFIIPAMFG
jgi:hypothetical protein